MENVERKQKEEIIVVLLCFIRLILIQYWIQAVYPSGINFGCISALLQLILDFDGHQSDLSLY